MITEYEHRHSLSSIRGPISSDRRAHTCLLSSVWSNPRCYLWQPEQRIQLRYYTWSFGLGLGHQLFGVMRPKNAGHRTGRKPTCWKCGETGHLSSFSPKKAPGLPTTGDPNSSLADTDSSLVPVMGLAATRAEKSGLVSVLHPTSQKKKPTRCTTRESKMKKGNGVSLVGTEGRTKQRGLSLLKSPRQKSPTIPIPSTNSKGDAQSSYATTATEIQKKCEPSEDKIFKLRQLKKELNAKWEKKSKPVGVLGTSSSAPSSSSSKRSWPYPVTRSLTSTKSKMTSLKKTTLFPQPFLHKPHQFPLPISHLHSYRINIVSHQKRNEAPKKFPNQKKEKKNLTDSGRRLLRIWQSSRKINGTLQKDRRP